MSMKLKTASYAFALVLAPVGIASANLPSAPELGGSEAAMAIALVGVAVVMLQNARRTGNSAVKRARVNLPLSR